MAEAIPEGALDVLPETATPVIPEGALDELPETAVPASPLERPEQRGPVVDDEAGALVLDLPEFVPEVVNKAADAGVLFDKTAPTGHFLASLAIDDEHRHKAYEKALSAQFGTDVKVRVGKATGQLEYLDPESNRWALVTPPGSFFETVEGIGGPSIVLGSEALAGTAVAMFTRSPALTKFAASGGAFVGELMRLKLGQNLGVNEGVNESRMILEAAKEAGIALVAGEVTDRILRIGKFVLDAAGGRVLPKQTLDAIEAGTDASEQGRAMFDTVQEAQDVAKRINERIGAARMKFTLAQSTKDEDLLVLQDFFRRSPQFRREFGAFEDEQAAALRAFEQKINQPYRARSAQSAPGTVQDASTAETGEAVQRIASGTVERESERANVFVRKAEAELDEAVSSIRERPHESLGRELREFGSQEQEAFREWSREAASELDRIAGGREFIPNTRTLEVVEDIDATVNRALFPTLQKPNRALIGQAPDPDAGDTLEAETINKLFDPDARFTFREAWEAISALKRAERTTSKGLSTDEPHTGAIRRLYGALEQDLREAAQASPLRDHYDRFIRKYAIEKRRLDEGVVGKVMSKRGGRNSPYTVADDQVFRQFFTPGTDREAKELFGLIGEKPELMQGMREAIGDFYKRAVIEGGRPNPRKHQQFMRAYERPLNVFFNRGEVRDLARAGQVENVLKAREASRDRAVQQINSSFEAELANLNNPGRIVSLIMDPKNPDKARQLVEILEREKAPDVLRGVRAEFRKDMRERLAGAFQSGERVLSAANFDTFLNGKGGEKGFKEVAKNLFGEQYVNDLDTLNTALKIASRETRFPNRSNTAFWTDTVKTLARSYVGLFTRPGRIITAVDKIRGRAANEVLMRAMINPEDARKLLEMKGVSLKTRKAMSVIGAMGGSALFADFE